VGVERGGSVARRAARGVLVALLPKQAVFLFAPLLYVATRSMARRSDTATNSTD